ncbi:MAG: hypothetical protein MUD16_06555 [Desulfobacterales bacterium]|jgi:hypothetical protein|nr:hypothetical protein [Desulfobacterales bacterium]
MANVTSLSVTHMKDSNLMPLVLRIFGVHCLLRIVDHLGQFWMIFMTDHGSQFPLLLATLSPIILLSVCSYVLFQYADPLAAMLIRSNAPLSFPADTDAAWWYSVAFSLLGIWLLLSTIPANAVQLIANFSVSAHPVAGVSGYVERGAWRLLLQALLQLLIGLYLILRPSHLYSLIVRLRQSANKWNSMRANRLRKRARVLAAGVPDRCKCMGRATWNQSNKLNLSHWQQEHPASKI